MTLKTNVVHDQQEQLSADERMPVDWDNWIVIDSQHFEFPHETEVVMLQLRYSVSGQTERTKVSKQSQRLERNASEIIVAQIQCFKAVF